MSKCEDIRKELEAFLSDETDEPQKSRIRDHLKDCRNCSQALQRIKKLSGVLQGWQVLEPSPVMYEKLKARMKARDSFRARTFTYPFIRK
ncbi:MAG: zf-HC2 domain-containing protein, partial [Sedimentisphaerales bacterium]